MDGWVASLLAIQMWEEGQLSRRDALKATGGALGGLAVGTAAGTSSAAAQATYYRYDAMLIRLVDVEAQPPRFLQVRAPMYLTRPLLADCNTNHPCSIDVLAYRRTDDDDGNDDDGNDDDGNDDGDDDIGDDTDDDDDRCPGYASVVLLCHAQSPSGATVLTGLVPDVVAQFAERGYDYAVRVSPSNDTNVNDPETVANPCPARTGDDDDGPDDDDDQDDGTNDDAEDDDSDDAGDDQDDDTGDDQNDDDSDG